MANIRQCKNIKKPQQQCKHRKLKKHNIDRQQMKLTKFGESGLVDLGIKRRIPVQILLGVQLVLETPTSLRGSR